MKRTKITTLGLLLLVCTQACKHKPPMQPVNEEPAATQYPADVARIFVTKCATSGCHNESSYKNAGNLRLDDWQYLFDGGANGAAIVPYAPKYSPLLYFINTDSTKGIVAEPRMPFDATEPYDIEPVTAAEYDILRDWIAHGAPDKNGNIAFATNPEARQKMYLAQQNCDDLVAVIDAEKKIVMRYIYCGKTPGAIESAHNIKVDSKGRYAYITMYANGLVQKIDTRTDTVVGTTDLSLSGLNSCEVIALSPDGSKMVVTSRTGGKVAMINTENMQLTKIVALAPEAHGIAANAAFDTFYVTRQTGNFIYRVTESGITNIPIDNDPQTIASSRDPHEIMMSPDFSRYFLTCERSDEVRVLERTTNKILAAIPVGRKPQEMAMSLKMPYLFVTCIEDPVSSAIYKGSVYVINYNTLQVVKKITGNFAGPHGLTVDDRNGLLYVASTNDNTTGTVPHHPSACGGKNGYYRVFDIYTLEPYNNRTYEVSSFPYSFDARFKD